jgi:hypothetical protein
MPLDIDDPDQLTPADPDRLPRLRGYCDHPDCGLWLRHLQHHLPGPAPILSALSSTGKVTVPSAASEQPPACWRLPPSPSTTHWAGGGPTGSPPWSSRPSPPPKPGTPRQDTARERAHRLADDCCQHCCQAARQRLSGTDKSGTSVQSADMPGRPWTTCPELRNRWSEDGRCGASALRFAFIVLVGRR